MNVGQLFVRLGFKQDPTAPAVQNKFVKGLNALKGQVQDFSKSIKFGLTKGFQAGMENSEMQMFGFMGKLGNFIGKANLARLAILGLAAALSKWALNTMQAGEKLYKFSINTGMDTTALQKWQQQAGQAGVEAEEVANSFKMLQEKSIEAQMGGDTGAFQMAGVNWMADAQTQMAQVQKMLATRPAAMGTKLAKDMGLSEEMVTFLRMRDKLKPADENLILSKDEIAELKDFSIEFEASWQNFKMTMTKLGVMILPITKPIFYMLSRIMEMTGAFTVWLNSLGKWKMALLTIAGSIALAVTAMFFPITATVMAVVAIVAGIALAIEDVYTFFQGGESFTGDILSGKLFEGLKEGFDKGVAWMRENWDVLTDWMGEELKNIFNLLLEGFKYIGDAILGVVDAVLEKFGLLDVSKAVGKGLDATASGLGTAWGKVSSWFGGDEEKKPAAPAVMGGAALAGAGARGGVNQSINIQIDGTKDPKAVADAVHSKLKKETSNAVYQMPRQEM